MSPHDFDRWLAWASNVAAGILHSRLLSYPILQPQANPLTEQALEAADVEARRRWRCCPNTFPAGGESIRWLREIAYRESLRRVLSVNEVCECLEELCPEQRRILLCLYVDQLTFQQLGLVVVSTGPVLRPRCRAAYDALRGRIAVRLGEGRDAFPLYPAAAGWGF